MASASESKADVAAPKLLDLTIDNITPNAIKINSQSPDARLRYLMARLITHLHDFARETRLSTEEWMAGLNFLIGTGKMCTDLRNEFVLLSDILGFSMLIDGINHPTPPGGTEGTVLGPFHTHDAPMLPNGASITSDPDGEPMLAVCTVKDLRGRPLVGVNVDIWETDSSGHYDVQHANRDQPSERCVMISDEQGRFWFKGLRPKDGWDKLITALYIRGDPYETSDAVFGVKQSLIIDLEKVDKTLAEEYAVEEGTWLLKYDFVLSTQEEADTLRDKLAQEALQKLGLKMKLKDHLPGHATQNKRLLHQYIQSLLIISQQRRTNTTIPDPGKLEFVSIENLKNFDPFAEADEDPGSRKKTQEYIHIRIQQRNGRKVLTTIQRIPPKFDHKKILKVIKKDFSCNGTIISDEDSKGLGEVIQLQGDQRNKIKEFLTGKDNGLGLEGNTIKVHGF
ncbi:hypothetical protein P8C59_001162 [Phyllachora maydis]|uniref:SUI1 domain-containing protein n=1 Tax=Phyllachora maydis TaxID=1825666 RepID=A0AAD9HXN6_9PEZI|nr:hypothetical protein P8C59_001162 [Phyllachora maydis]